MKIKVIPGNFSVCKVHDYSQVNWNMPYCFIGKTEEENSLVCLSSCVPENVVVCEDGWCAFCIEGILDFSLLGILAKISNLLAENGISIFAIPIYNTDYIFTKKENCPRAFSVLRQAGWQVLE